MNGIHICIPDFYYGMEVYMDSNIYMDSFYHFIIAKPSIFVVRYGLAIAYYFIIIKN